MPSSSSVTMFNDDDNDDDDDDRGCGGGGGGREEEGEVDLANGRRVCRQVLSLPPSLAFFSFASF